MPYNQQKEKESKLYHYTKMDTLIEYILKDNKLRAGKLVESNDPKETSEMNFFITTGLSNYEDRKKVLNNFFNQKQRIISENIKEYSKIICFSLDSVSPKCKGYNHPRMWAQYAENNKGVCLVLNKRKFQNEFDEKFEHYKTYCGKVTYDFRDNEEYTRAYTLNLNDNNSINEIISKKMDKYYKEYFFSKHYDWIQENEFRYVINSDEKNFFYISINESLEKIVLGNNVDPKKKKEIKKLLDKSELEVELYEYTISYGYYNISKV